MKNISLPALLLLTSGVIVHAQNNINFGLQAGVIINDWRYQTVQIDRPLTPGTYPATLNSDDRYPAIGYLIGATAQYSITSQFAAGVNVSFYQSGSTNKHQYRLLDGNQATYTSFEDYRFQYIQFPVWFQYTATKYKFRPYIRTGPAYTYRLQSKLGVSTTYNDNTRTPATGHSDYARSLDTPLAYVRSFPRHDWQLMSEVGIAISKHIKLGIRYDFLAPQRTVIEVGPGDAGTFRFFRNRNVGLLTEISF